MLSLEITVSRCKSGCWGWAKQNVRLHIRAIWSVILFVEFEARLQAKLLNDVKLMAMEIIFSHTGFQLDKILQFSYDVALFKSNNKKQLSQAIIKCVLCHMRTTKAQISLRMRAVWSAPLLFAA